MTLLLASLWSREWGQLGNNLLKSNVYCIHVQRSIVTYHLQYICSRCSKSNLPSQFFFFNTLCPNKLLSFKLSCGGLGWTFGRTSNCLVSCSHNPSFSLDHSIEPQDRHDERKFWSVFYPILHGNPISRYWIDRKCDGFKNYTQKGRYENAAKFSFNERGL